MKEALPEKKYLTLIRSLQLKQFSSKRVIYPLGRDPGHVFLIIRGSVYIMLPRKTNFERWLRSDTGIGEGAETAQTQKDSSRTQSRSQHADAPETRDAADKNLVETLYPDFSVARALASGDHFGEIYSSYQVPASLDMAVSKEACCCAVLDSRTLQVFLPAAALFRGSVHPFQCLRKCALLAPFPDYAVRLLTDFVEEFTYPVNRILYTYGERADYIYFIRQGQVEVSTTIGAAMDPRQRSKCHWQPRQSSNLTATGEASQLSTSSYMSHQPLHLEQKNVPPVLLGANQCFGSDGILDHQCLAKRCCEVYTKSNCQFYRISREVFQKYFYALFSNFQGENQPKPAKTHQIDVSFYHRGKMGDLKQIVARQKGLGQVIWDRFRPSSTLKAQPLNSNSDEIQDRADYVKQFKELQICKLSSQMRQDPEGMDRQLAQKGMGG